MGGDNAEDDTDATRDADGNRDRARGTQGAKGAAIPTAVAPPIPKVVPTKPPAIEGITTSMMNGVRISCRLAPMA